MNGTEIISLIQSALPIVQSAISAIGGAIFTAVFLRKNTSTQEFEKLKAGKMQEVADDLLESGKMMRIISFLSSSLWRFDSLRYMTAI